MPVTKRKPLLVNKPFLSKPADAIENHLLASLPEKEYVRLLPHLELVSFEKGTVLYHAGDSITYCYFPLNGFISILFVTEDDKSVEVATVGSEGVIGEAALLQNNTILYQVIAQTESEAIRIKADIIKREFNNCPSLHACLLYYTHSLICQISQSTACQSFHTVKQRLSRWLLINRDQSQSCSFSVTQEFISRILGTPRTNIAMTISALEKAKLIRYKRGVLTIIDLERLEQSACDCYRIPIK